MHDPQNWNLEKIRGFLQNDPGSDCQAGSRQELYGWIQATWVEQEYFHLRKKERGLIRAFLSRVTRLSPAHLTRLIRQYRRAGMLPSPCKTRRCFPTTYTREDVAVVAETDRLHQRLSGPATRCLFETTGVKDVYLEQLYTFSHPSRDPHDHVVSVAYVALVNRARIDLRVPGKCANIGWFSVASPPPLAYDHTEMLEYALQRLRWKLEYTNIVYSLLPRDFTLIIRMVLSGFQFAWLQHP